MQKRGQLAIWIIVALVIVVLGISAYLLFPDFFKIGFNKQKAKQILFEQSENLRDTIAYCSEEVVKYCLEIIGKRGGYYYVDDLKQFDFAGNKSTIVYCYDGTFINKLPSLSIIFNKSLQDCMNKEGWEKFDNCVKLKNFEKFFSIKELNKRNLHVYALTDCEVYINLSWPMLLSKMTLVGKVEQKIDQKEVVFPMCVKKIWDISNDIINLEIEKGWYNNADKYIQENSYKLKNVDLRTQVPAGNYMVTIFMLTSVPFRPKEKEFPFYFAISRKDEINNKHCVKF